MKFSKAKKIPCSVNTMCRNNQNSIGRALKSVQRFDDICVLDGYSTDSTRDICEKYGARIFDQPKECLDGDGKLKNYSKARNYLMSKNKYDWQLILDSDEYFPEALVDEIERIVDTSAHHIVYEFNRKYEVDGVVIESASTYPMRQIRLAHRSSNSGFVREIHEGWDLRQGAIINICANHMIAVQPQLSELIGKWKYYININTTVRHKNMPIDYKNFFRGTLINYTKSVIFVLRKVLIYKFCGKTPHMPLKYELAKIWYQYAAASSITKFIFKREAKKLIRKLSR